MRTAGIILLVLTALNFIVLIAALSANEMEAAGDSLGVVITFGIIGAYCLHRANQKKEEQEQKDDFNTGE